MAKFDTITPAAPAASLMAFEEQARADGFLDDEGFFVGPPDALDADLTDIQMPVELPTR
ncbi:hypothetical protein [Roseateles sp.]|uniref:hypothetical protein n=1 Tax=Roseateles sp. TaxID=1971397 RepID=UPI0031DBCD2C